MDPAELTTSWELPSFLAHSEDSVKSDLKKQNIDVTVVSGGLVLVLQPLDKCLNKPFKDNIWQKVCTWYGWHQGHLSSTQLGRRHQAKILSSIGSKKLGQKFHKKCLLNISKAVVFQMPWMEQGQCGLQWALSRDRWWGNGGEWVQNG